MPGEGPGKPVGDDGRSILGWAYGKPAIECWNETGHLEGGQAAG